MSGSIEFSGIRECCDGRSGRLILMVKVANWVKIG